VGIQTFYFVEFPGFLPQLRALPSTDGAYFNHSEKACQIFFVLPVPVFMPILGGRLGRWVLAALYSFANVI
jgi:hypothetical protein